MTNLHYNNENKKLICDSNPKATEYEFCVAPSGTEDWDSVISPLNYRSVADKSGSQKGKGREKINGEYEMFCEPIEFTIT
jgi:hypothetical protein